MVMRLSSARWYRRPRGGVEGIGSRTGVENRGCARRSSIGSSSSRRGLRSSLIGGALLLQIERLALLTIGGVGAVGAGSVGGEPKVEGPLLRKDKLLSEPPRDLTSPNELRDGRERVGFRRLRKMQQDGDLHGGRRRVIGELEGVGR